MFLALKKLASKQEIAEKPPDAAGIPMSGLLQKKFSRGVNYNMKIIIKGDRNVGKSCLFKRLQGGGFQETYTPTEEIQVASIQWSFKATEDIVKVEVWDVVDKGKARSWGTGLKVNTEFLAKAPALDAEFLNVYKGTHGVILMMDVTKSWTFDYIAREFTKIPIEIPVLVLGNHCDMAHHRVVSIEEAQSFIESAGRNRNSEVIYSESSMRNGFGLRLLHKFLGLPFLRLQKEAFLALIERNARDSEICGMEIKEFLMSDDADYNKFLNKLSNTRRQVADSNSRPTQSSSVYTSMSQTTTPEGDLRPMKSIIVGRGQPIVVPGDRSIAQSLNGNTVSSYFSPGSKPELSATTQNTKQINTNLLKKNDEKALQSSHAHNITKEESKIISVEEFCPEEQALDRHFLDDIPLSKSVELQTLVTQNDSDSDNNGNIPNPLVARFDDEPDSGVSNENNGRYMSYSKIQSVKTNPLAKTNKSSSENFANSLEVNKMFISRNTIKRNSSASAPINLDSWTQDATIRRSPEGGEDSISDTNNAKDFVLTKKVSSTHKKKKLKKEKNKIRSDRKEKKKIAQSPDSSLENFLDGSDERNQTEENYEKI